MMKPCAKLWVSGVLLLAILSSLGCSQSPVRNPFAGRTEPKLGELMPLPESKQEKIATVSWTTNALAKQERFSKLQPFVSSKVIYAADHTGKVIALDRSSGKKIWRSNTKHKFAAGPSLIGANLLLATQDAKVISLEASTGKVIWEAKVSSEVLSAPVGSQGVVLVNAIDGSISALDIQNGQSLWRVDQSIPSLTLRSNSSPVISEDKAFVGFSTGKLLALNLHSGLIEWERTISLPKGRSELDRMVDISADPIVMNEIVYVINYQGKLAAVNAVSGDLIWEREISSYHNMAISGDRLFVTDNEHCLWAIDRNTGTTLWRQAALAERYITGPAVVGNMIAVADRGGVVHFLSLEKGTFVNRLKLAEKFYQNPLSLGNSLLVNSYGGKVAAIQLHPNGGNS